MGKKGFTPFTDSARGTAPTSADIETRSSLSAGARSELLSVSGERGRSASALSLVDCSLFWLDPESRRLVSASEFKHGAFAQVIPRTCEVVS